jgi:hypothetical protein
LVGIGRKGSGAWIKLKRYPQHVEKLNRQECDFFRMKPKLINGEVWIYVDSEFGGGYRKLPMNDPKYREILLWIDSQRFVELLDWVYNERSPKKNHHRAVASTP